MRANLLLAGIISLAAVTAAQPKAVPSTAYTIEFGTRIAGTPEEVFDLATGDVRPWWDHTFSPAPLKLYIEPRPGGGFWEIFNERGDGVRHATVIGAERGKLLRLDGPLGLAGRAVTMVTTYTFAPTGADSTDLTLSVHLSGEIDAQTAGVVEKVWRHFIIERFAPYAAGRRGGK
jgi:hypothetical protein